MKFKWAVMAVAMILAMGAGPVMGQGSLDSGQAALARGNYEQALAIFNSIIKQGGLPDKDLAEVYFERGNTYADMGFGYREQALNDYQQARKLNPGEPKYVWAISYIQRDLDPYDPCDRIGLKPGCPERSRFPFRRFH